MEDAPPGAADPRSEVRAALAAISRAWRERRYAALAAAFAPDIVFALPGLAGRLEGAEAVVASYREFMDRATLTAYHEEPAEVDAWGDTAVATFRWEMAWVAGGVANHGAGRDTFVFCRRAGDEGDNGGWVAVWRTMAFEPDPADEPAA